jgi:hypothetical protein
MSTSLSWPAILPLPSIAGYQIKPVPNVDRTEVDVGPARQRRRSTAARDEITVQFRLTLWQQMFFEAWHRNVALEGATWFNITYLGGVGLVSCEARFKVGSDVTYVPATGQCWTASAVLEVRNRPMLSADDIATLQAEDPVALLAAVNAFTTFVYSGFSS